MTMHIPLRGEGWGEGTTNTLRKDGIALSIYLSLKTFDLRS